MRGDPVAQTAEPVFLQRARTANTVIAHRTHETCRCGAGAERPSAWRPRCLIALVSPSQATKYAAASTPPTEAFLGGHAPPPAAVRRPPAPVAPAPDPRRAATAAAPGPARAAPRSPRAARPRRGRAGRAPAEREPSSCCAWRSSSPIETSRCCAPSCRSRSIRRRSVSRLGDDPRPRRLAPRQAGGAAPLATRDLDRQPARLHQLGQRVRDAAAPSARCSTTRHRHPGTLDRRAHMRRPPASLATGRPSAYRRRPRSRAG